jgi:hypothetical protein
VLERALTDYIACMCGRFIRITRGSKSIVAGAVRRKDEKQNVALAIHRFCRRLQCCCKRFDSRIAAFSIEFYDNRPMGAHNGQAVARSLDAEGL